MSDSETIFQEARGSAQVPESDIVQACRRVSALELSQILLSIYVVLLINRIRNLLMVRRV